MSTNEFRKKIQNDAVNELLKHKSGTAKLAKEKYKRGDKHHTDEKLIFYQYHHPYFKDTNGEVWLTIDEFNKRKEAHRISTANYKRRKPLIYIVSGTIQRDKQKYNTSKDKIIDIAFIEQLLIKQNNKCFWYNIELEIDSIEGSRNPAKLTIDMLDCSKGYSKNNVVLTCYAANCGRGDCSVEIWENIIKNIKNGLNTKS